MVDQNLTHIWKLLLHEIAVGALNAHSEELNYYAHVTQHDYKFVLGRFSQLDHVHKSILLEHPFSGTNEDQHHYSLSYDTLIFAIGSTSNDFNTEGVGEHCHFLDSRVQAEQLQQLMEFEKDHLNRLKVYATLQTKTDPNIFAFGDCAHCQPIVDEPVLGPRAQVASQQAHFLVSAMSPRIKNKAQPMFKFADKGSLVLLSHHKAVRELLGQMNVQAWVAKSLFISYASSKLTWIDSHRLFYGKRCNEQKTGT